LQHERYINITFFGLGFLWDTITLQRIDLLFENIVFIWNLTLVAGVIVLLNVYDANRLHNKITNKVAPFLPIVLQFSFGGLFSAFTVFYFKSASVSSSWPFLIFLLGLFIGNEFFRSSYTRLTFQLGIFFVALFSYSAFLLPILLGRLGNLIFIASGFAALLMIGLLIYLMLRIIRERIVKAMKALIISIGCIYIAFNLAYFLNIIPPIPLALKESGIYHTIQPIKHKSFIYALQFEPSPWYKPFRQEDNTFHWSPGDNIFSYSSIFAPTKIDTNIYHRWKYYDETKKEWVQYAKISFPVRGGRDGGYRGYTVISNARPGNWFVEVINEQGQVLGRRNFRVVTADSQPILETTYK
jgi:hypothetical protein